MRHLLDRLADATSRLTEGMREGDLADLVLPLISVDEFISKVDEQQSVVFGFYVHDQAAADDLNRFLQKSAVPILDTEISPAPDQHGYYMVFVELTDNERLADNVEDIITEIDSLVDIDEWQLRVRNHPDLIPFTPENLAQALKMPNDQMVEHAILEFLHPSLLTDARIDGEVLILSAGRERLVFEVVGFDRLTKLLGQHKLDEAAIACDLRTIARTNRINRMLGEAWTVVELQRYLLLSSNDDPRGLLLR